MFMIVFGVVAIFMFCLIVGLNFMYEIVEFVMDYIQYNRVKIGKSDVMPRHPEYFVWD